MESTEITSKPTVMSVGLKFGLILGIISIAQNLIQLAIGSNPLESNWMNMLLGIVITVVVVVFAHKNFKDNGDSYMSYGQGLGIAMVAIIVSIVLTGVFTYVYFKMIDPSAFEAIWEKTASQMEEKGQSEEQIEMALTWGRNLFWVFYILGGAFWGLIIGLIVSIFTQKTRPEQPF